MQIAVQETVKRYVSQPFNIVGTEVLMCGVQISLRSVLNTEHQAQWHNTAQKITGASSRSILYAAAVFRLHYSTRTRCKEVHDTPRGLTECQTQIRHWT